MAITYEKFPPTADDVMLDPSFVSAVSGDSDEDVVVFTIAQDDAYRFARDIERNKDGNVNLNEVRRGLATAAAVLTDETIKSIYLRGVDSFIECQLVKSN